MKSPVSQRIWWTVNWIGRKRVALATKVYYVGTSDLSIAGHRLLKTFWVLSAFFGRDTEREREKESIKRSAKETYMKMVHDSFPRKGCIKRWPVEIFFRINDTFDGTQSDPVTCTFITQNVSPSTTPFFTSIRIEKKRIGSSSRY